MRANADGLQEARDTAQQWKQAVKDGARGRVRGCCFLARQPSNMGPGVGLEVAAAKHANLTPTPNLLHTLT